MGFTPISMLLYACTIFLSAFLLFQVQPLIAKMILPWFGGSAAVWTACVLFFQLLLLLGYLYSHWTIRYLRPRTQTILHTVLLAASLFMLPAIPNVAWKPTGGEDPTLRILGLLGATIGLPYFLLSTTGPLIQAWFVRERFKAGRDRLPALFALESRFHARAVELSGAGRAVSRDANTGLRMVRRLRGVRPVLRRHCLAGTGAGPRQKTPSSIWPPSNGDPKLQSPR